MRERDEGKEKRLGQRRPKRRRRGPLRAIVPSAERPPVAREEPKAPAIPADDAKEPAEVKPTRRTPPEVRLTEPFEAALRGAVDSRALERLGLSQDDVRAMLLSLLRAIADRPDLERASLETVVPTLFLSGILSRLGLRAAASGGASPSLVGRAVMALPPDLREVVVPVVIVGRSVEHVASALRLSVGAAEARLAKGLRLVRSRLAPGPATEVPSNVVPFERRKPRCDT